MRLRTAGPAALLFTMTTPGFGKADCQGTLQMTTPEGLPTNFNTVTVNGGTELFLLETDSDTFVSGTAQQ